MESKQSGNMLFPDDVAWADSCLVKDSEISYSNWDSMKDALRHILTSQPDSLAYPAAKRDGLTGGNEIEIHPRNGDDGYVVEKDRLNSGTNLGNHFLQNYCEYMKDSENPVPGLDLDFPAFVPEPSSDDIFRIWKLGIPNEEVELVTQLNNALSESSLLPMPSTSNDSGMKEDSLVGLITGISDLSLNKNS